MARQPTDTALVAAGVAYHRTNGLPVPEAAAKAGISTRVLYRALAAGVAPSLPKGAKRPPRAVAPTATSGAINADGDPLAIMRQLLASATDTIASLESDSPRLNPARGEARALTKAIAAIERERAAKESPEEAARRLRREDGETRARIEAYVVQYEEEAAERGVCVHCGGRVAA